MALFNHEDINVLPVSEVVEEADYQEPFEGMFVEQTESDSELSTEDTVNPFSRARVSKALEDNYENSKQNGGIGKMSDEELEKKHGSEEEHRRQKEEQKEAGREQRKENRKKALEELGDGLIEAAKATGKGVKETARIAYNLALGKDKH